jgi:hypothetical protein
VVGYVRESTGSFTNGMLVLVGSLWIGAVLTFGIRKEAQAGAKAG